MPEALFVLRTAVAVVLIAAATAKAMRPSAFVEGLDSYGLIPRPFAALLACLTIIAELTLGLLLISATSVAVAAISAGFLFSSFTAARMISYTRGRRPPCHCFGTSVAERVSMSTSLRSLLLALACVPLAVLPQPPMFVSLEATFALVPIALAAAVLLRSVSLMPIVINALVTRPRPVPTRLSSGRISLREAGLDVSLLPRPPQGEPSRG